MQEKIEKTETIIKRTTTKRPNDSQFLKFNKFNIASLS